MQFAKVKRRVSLGERIERLPVERLQSRIEGANRKALCALCRKVAQTLFDAACRAAGQTRDMGNPACAPHRSRGRWGTIDNEPERIRRMKRKIESRLARAL